MVYSYCNFQCEVSRKYKKYIRLPYIHLIYLYCRIKEGNIPSLNLAKKLGFEKIDYHLQEDSENMQVWRYACREMENQLQ